MGGGGLIKNCPLGVGRVEGGREDPFFTMGLMEGLRERLSGNSGSAHLIPIKLPMKLWSCLIPHSMKPFILLES